MTTVDTIIIIVLVFFIMLGDFKVYYNIFKLEERVTELENKIKKLESIDEEVKEC